ncbi:MAG: NAD(P)H-dependent oxidoreductase subunit E [Candidatus Bipolaricaulota bacterium]
MADKPELLLRHPRSEDRLLAILHDLQEASPNNSLTRDDLTLVAQHLELPVSRVHDAVTFYSMFSLRPRGRHLIRVCDSPHCHLGGSWSVLEELQLLLGIKTGETTEDGLFTLELSSCLGVCGVAPVMMVDEEMVGNLTPDRLRQVIDRYREGL